MKATHSMSKRKRRIPPEERGGRITTQDEHRVTYEFPGRAFEAYEKRGAYLKLLYRWQADYGLFFQCKTCHSPHALLWRDYLLYVKERRQAGDETPSYKVLCIDGDALLRLARPGEQVDGRLVTSLGEIDGDLFKEYIS